MYQLINNFKLYYCSLKYSFIDMKNSEKVHISHFEGEIFILSDYSIYRTIIGTAIIKLIVLRAAFNSRVSNIPIRINKCKIYYCLDFQTSLNNQDFGFSVAVVFF